MVRYAAEFGDDSHQRAPASPRHPDDQKQKTAQPAISERRRQYAQRGSGGQARKQSPHVRRHSAHAHLKDIAGGKRELVWNVEESGKGAGLFMLAS